MDQFIIDLASDCCQNTLGIESDVVAIAPGIAVVQDQESSNWLLCFDMDRWEKRNAGPRQWSRSCIMVATEHFLVGIVVQWFCSKAKKPDSTMRAAALRMLEALESEGLEIIQDCSVEVFARQSSRS